MKKIFLYLFKLDLRNEIVFKKYTNNINIRTFVNAVS